MIGVLGVVNCIIGMLEMVVCDERTGEGRGGGRCMKKA